MLIISILISRIYIYPLDEAILNKCSYRVYITLWQPHKQNCRDLNSILKFSFIFKDIASLFIKLHHKGG